MELVPDYTLLIQVVLFVVLWLGLKRLLFEPVLEVLEQRRERTVGRLARAREEKAGAEAAEGEYEGAIREARVRVAREGEEAQKGVWEEQAKMLAGAREKAGEEIARSRAELAAQYREAREKLGGEAQAIAEQMVARVTGGA